MTRDQFNAYCRRLRGTTKVVQWGGAHVWKVGPKVFALCGWEPGSTPAFTFKVSELGWMLLSTAPGCRPAPYLASRGMKWIQVYGAPGLGDADLKRCITESYTMVIGKLPVARRRALKVGEFAPAQRRRPS
jgi:predicted DNA-binding protein (MmcQ/YjbR family)